MAAGERKLNIGLTVRFSRRAGVQGEAKAAQRIADKTRCPDSGIPLRLPVDADRHHHARGPRAHRPDQRVVSVEHRYTGVGKSLHQLTLGLRDGWPATELPDMGHAYIEHESDIGRSDAAQVGNV